MEKKRKILLGALISIVCSGLVYAAIVVIVKLVTGDGYESVIKNKLVYGVWALLTVVGIAAVAIDTRVRGSKRVLKVNADLEDSHFMTKREMLKNAGYTFTKLSELNNVKDGIPVVAEKKRKGEIEIVLREPIHTLYIGATGTGKTVGCVSPTIEILSRTKTKPSLMITDPKGELYARHAATLKKSGYRVTLIDLSDVYRSTHWNPFNDVWRKTDEMTRKVEQRQGKYEYGGKVYLTEEEAERARKENAVRLSDEIYVDLQDLIYTMCPVENKQDSTWQRGARDLLLALSLGFWEDARDGYLDRDKFNLYNLYRNVTDYAKGECEALKAYFETRSETSRTRGLSNTVLVSQDRTLTSYLGDVNQYLSWMADKGIAALTSGNEIEFGEFDESANALFLKIPDEKENRYKLVALLITQMYKALVEKATKNAESGKTNTQKLLRNVYFIMDEFGNLPRLYKMDGVVTVGRSRGIFMMPVIQDFNQLDSKYGKEVAATIRSNCNVQVFIGTNDENTRRLFSEACGKKKARQISYSENKDMSVSTSAGSVPLIYPNELEHLNDPANGIIGNTIVLSLGNYPMRGKMTPIYLAMKEYGIEQTSPENGDFNDFDETAHHYDITKTALFMASDRKIREDPAESDLKAEGVRNTEAQGTTDSPMRTDVNEIRIKKKIEVLRGKIPQSDYEYLLTAKNGARIAELSRLSEEVAARGSYLLSVEIENVKSFIERSGEKEEESREAEIANYAQIGGGA